MSDKLSLDFILNNTEESKKELIDILELLFNIFKKIETGSKEDLDKKIKAKPAANSLRSFNNRIKDAKERLESLNPHSKQYAVQLKRIRVLTEHAKKAQNRLNKELKGGDESLRRYGSLLGELGRKVGALIGGAYSIYKVIDFFKEAKDAIRDAAEIQSKFNVVFSGNVEAVEEWAKSYSDAVGRNATDIKKYAAEVGDVLKPLGFGVYEASELSKKIVQLGLDVASFNNRADADVIHSFISALTGERESLKTLGIVISEADVKQEAFNSGLQKQGEELSKTAKALATINLLYKNSKDAQGDLLRTSDSLANVEKKRDAQLKTTLETWGNRITPLYRIVLDLETKLLSAATLRISEEEKALNNAARLKSKFEELSFSYLKLKEKTNKTATEQKLFNDIIAELQKNYPEYLKNVNLQKDSYENVALAIKKAGEELDKYLEKQIKTALLKDKEAEVIELGKEEYRLNKEILDYERKRELYKDGKSYGNRPSGTDQYTVYTTAINNNRERLSEIKRQKEEIRKEIDEINKSISGLFVTPPGNKRTPKTEKRVEISNVFEYEELDNWDSFEEEQVKRELERQKKLQEKIDKLKIEAIKDKKIRELAFLDEWYNEELEKYGMNKYAKEQLDKIYQRRKEEIISNGNEKLNKKEINGYDALKNGYNTFVDEFIIGNRRAADSWDAVWLSMRNTALRALAEILIEQAKVGIINNGENSGNSESGNGLGILSFLASIIPFASGGIVTKPTVGLVGEAGPEAIIPLNKIDAVVKNTPQVNVVNKITIDGNLKLSKRELYLALQSEKRMLEALT